MDCVRPTVDSLLSIHEPLFDRSTSSSLDQIQLLMRHAAHVLNTQSADEKAKLSFQIAEMWFSGNLEVVDEVPVPDQPSRPSNVIVVPPGIEQLLPHIDFYFFFLSFHS